jgi:hypothetical protein
VVFTSIMTIPNASGQSMGTLHSPAKRAPAL